MASAAEINRLTTCVATGARVHAMLRESTLLKSDVAEFVFSVQSAESAFREILTAANGGVDGFRVPMFEVAGVLASLEALERVLRELTSSGRLTRFVTNRRLRKKLEDLNVTLHGKIKELCEAAPRIVGNKSTLHSAALVPDDAASVTAGDGDSWEDLFGDANFMVPWDVFMKRVVEYVGVAVTEAEEALMSHMIDISQTGMVSKFKFIDFLKGFGPLKACITNMKRILGAPWFFGFLSKSETELALLGQKRGTFLVRFRIASDSFYAMACVMHKDEILHVLVRAADGGGFTVRDTREDGRVFATLHELVAFYGHIFKKPLAYALTNEPWFHGDLSSDEAAELLAGREIGTFLIRFSGNTKGWYAMSWLDGENSISHVRFQKTPEGYVVQGENTVFASMLDVIDTYADILKVPLPNPQSEINDLIRKHIQSGTAGGDGSGSGHASPRNSPRASVNALTSSGGPGDLSGGGGGGGGDAAGGGGFKTAFFGKWRAQPGETVQTANMQMQKGKGAASTVRATVGLHHTTSGRKVTVKGGNSRPNSPVLERRLPSPLPAVINAGGDVQTHSVVPPRQWSAVSSSEQSPASAEPLYGKAPPIVAGASNQSVPESEAIYDDPIGALKALQIGRQSVAMSASGGALSKTAGGGGGGGGGGEEYGQFNPIQAHLEYEQLLPYGGIESVPKALLDSKGSVKLSGVGGGGGNAQTAAMEMATAQTSSTTGMASNESIPTAAMADATTAVGLLTTLLLPHEQAYVAALDRLIQGYYAPIQSGAMLGDDEFRQIFLHIADFHAAHTTCAKHLAAAASPTGAGTTMTPAAVTASILDAYAPLMSTVAAYEAYCGNLVHLTLALDRAVCRDAFATFLIAQLQSAEFGGQSLFECLLKPLQQLYSYPLILQDLLNTTAPSSAAHERLCGMIARLHSVAVYGNSCHGEASRLQQVLNVQNAVFNADNLAVPGRALVCTGELQARGAADDAWTTCCAFLFNDLLMWAKAHGKDLVYDAHVQLDALQASAVADVDTDFVVASGGDEKARYTFRCATAQDCSFWLKQLLVATQSNER